MQGILSWRGEMGKTETLKMSVKKRMETEKEKENEHHNCVGTCSAVLRPPGSGRE